MEAFVRLELSEQIRRERLVRAERRRLRLDLLMQRNFIAAGLEERQLAELTSDARFHALREQIRALAAFASVQDRANLLAQAIRSMQRRKAAEVKLTLIRQSIAERAGP